MIFTRTVVNLGLTSPHHELAVWYIVLRTCSDLKVALRESVVY